MNAKKIILLILSLISSIAIIACSSTNDTTPQVVQFFSTYSSVEGVSISVEDYNFGKDPYIKIKWQNDTNEEFFIGEYFDLLYTNGISNSYSCAKDEVVFKDIALIIPAHDSYTKTYNLSSFDVSKKGYYTFAVNFNGSFLADFSLGYDVYDASSVTTKIRIYKYDLSPDPMPATLKLMSDGTATFTYSALSSYLNIGTYTNDGEKIVMTTDDNLYRFTFIIDGEKLIFDAKNSSELQRFRYESDGAPICPVPDGAVFE